MRKDRNTRLKLMKAALEVFTEKGFRGASTREIVGKSGVTKPTLYYHFGNKENLYRTLLKETFDLFNRESERIAGSQDNPANKLLLIVEYYLEHCRRFPERVKLMLMAIYRPDAFSPEVDLQEYARPGLEAIARVIREGIDKKLFRKADPLKLCFQLVGMIHAQTLIMLPPSNHLPTSKPGEIVATFINGIRKPE